MEPLNQLSATVGEVRSGGERKMVFGGDGRRHCKDNEGRCGNWEEGREILIDLLYGIL